MSGRTRAVGAGAAGARGPSRRCHGSPAACPRGRWSGRPNSRATSGTGPRPGGRHRPGATCSASRPGWRSTTAGRRWRAPPRTTRGRSSAWFGSPTGTRRATTSRSRGRPVSGPRTSRNGSRSRARTASPTRSRPVGQSIFVGLHFGAIELPALFLAVRVGGAVAPMETLDRPGPPGLVRPDPWARSASGSWAVREARRELTAALRDGTSVGLVGDRDLTGGGTLTELFGAPARLPLGPGAARRRDRRAAVRGGRAPLRGPRPLRGRRRARRSSRPRARAARRRR